MDNQLNKEIEDKQVEVTEDTIFKVIFKIAQDGIGAAPEVQERGGVPILPDKVFRCGLTILEVHIGATSSEEEKIVIYKCQYPNSPYHPSILASIDSYIY